MTNNALAMRDNRSADLQVFQVNGGGDYIVGSSKGKILYNVFAVNGNKSCTCADYITNSKSDSGFVCKHILAAINTNGNSIPVNPLKIWKPKLDDRFIKDYRGKDFVVYSGLLDLAHQKGLCKVIVEILQFPTKDNGSEAICRAILESYNGERFIEIGDASPKNVNKMIASHIIRMAATRAKARAMRDFTNIGMTCLEEIGEADDDVKGKSFAANNKPADKPKPTNNYTKPADKEKTESEKPSNYAGKVKSEEKKAVPEPESNAAPATNNGSGSHPSLSMAQKNAIFKLASRRSISEFDVEAKSMEAFGCIVDSLTPEDASSFIRELQKSA